MMLEFSPEEEKLWDMMDHEKDPKKWKELHEKYRKLRKEREDRELKDCIFAHEDTASRKAGGIFIPNFKKERKRQWILERRSVQ